MQYNKTCVNAKGRMKRSGRNIEISRTNLVIVVFQTPWSSCFSNLNRKPLILIIIRAKDQLESFSKQSIWWSDCSQKKKSPEKTFVFFLSCPSSQKSLPRRNVTKLCCVQMVAKTGCGYITQGDLRKVCDNRGIPGMDDGKLKCNEKHCVIMFSLKTNFAISAVVTLMVGVPTCPYNV